MDARRVVGTSRFMFAKNDENTEFPLFMFEFYLFSSGMTLTRSQSVGRRAHLQAFTFLMALTLKITFSGLTSTYPSVHLLTVLSLKLTVGCPSCMCVSIRKIMVGCLWSTHKSVITKKKKIARVIVSITTLC